jgi:hypothetical protein
MRFFSRAPVVGAAQTVLVRGYHAKRRRIDDRRRCGGVMRGDLTLDLGDAGK